MERHLGLGLLSLYKERETLKGPFDPKTTPGFLSILLEDRADEETCRGGQTSFGLGTLLSYLYGRAFSI